MNLKKWFENLKISRKLIAGFLIVSLLGVATGVVGIMSLVNMARNQRNTYDQSTMGIKYSLQAETELLKLKSMVRDLYIHYDTEKEDLASQISDQFKLVEERIGLYVDNVAGSDDQEYVAAGQAAYDTYRSGITEILDAAKAGANADQLFDLLQKHQNDAEAAVSAFEDVCAFNSSRALGSINSDEAASTAAIYILGGICAASLIIALFLAAYISKSISNPMRLFAAFAEMLAVGDIEVDKVIGEKDKLLKYRKDEIGILADSFNKVIAGTIEQAHETQVIANGDLTAAVTIRSDSDMMGKALSELVEKFRNFASSIILSADQVDSEAKLVADSSTSLSQGATEQASSVEELTASLEEIASHTSLNAQNAKTASDLSENIRKDAEAGNSRMADMLHAMQEVSRSSGNIRKIIKVIEDIAFQTNILALNAAVEAARAGQQGRGFAVVAEEVRTLAAKSAQAAKETTELIETSIKTAETGSGIADETAAALSQIVSEIEKATALISSIAAASNEQAAALEQVNQGVLQVSQVVQSNAAASEECAAASEELSGQADGLKDSVGIFKIRNAYAAPDEKADAPAKKQTAKAACPA